MLLFTQNAKPDAVFTFEMERAKSLAVDMERIHRGVSPEAVAGGDSPILDRWCLGSRVVPCLMGFSTGHPTLTGQNRLITTSDVWLMSEDMGWARTLSRWYRLGRPSDFSDLDS
ncbi:DUF6634 family protein [Mesorhizobium sp. A623]